MFISKWAHHSTLYTHICPNHSCEIISLTSSVWLSTKRNLVSLHYTALFSNGSLSLAVMTLSLVSHWLLWRSHWPLIGCYDALTGISLAVMTLSLASHWLLWRSHWPLIGCYDALTGLSLAVMTLSPASHWLLCHQYVMQHWRIARADTPNTVTWCSKRANYIKNRDRDTEREWVGLHGAPISCFNPTKKMYAQKYIYILIIWFK